MWGVAKCEKRREMWQASERRTEGHVRWAKHLEARVGERAKEIGRARGSLAAEVAWEQRRDGERWQESDEQVQEVGEQQV